MNIGRQGDRGARGEQGFHGDQGIQGLQGVHGDTGERGEKGERGNNVSRRNQWIMIIILLVPPWSMFLMAVYWVFWDDKPPVTLAYQHPKFLSGLATNRDEAKLFEIDTVKSGSPVWVYREICVIRPYTGTVKAAWETASSSWPSPERPIEEKKIGCRVSPSYLLAPASNPSRTFDYRADLWTENNPLTVIRVELPPLRLRVIAPGSAE
jgi:hypothetical protein